MLGASQPVILHLLDIEPAKQSLEGVKMELMDAAFPLLQGKLHALLLLDIAGDGKECQDQSVTFSKEHVLLAQTQFALPGLIPDTNCLCLQAC